MTHYAIIRYVAYSSIYVHFMDSPVWAFMFL